VRTYIDKKLATEYQKIRARSFEPQSAMVLMSNVTDAVKEVKALVLKAKR
jgi:hypothetical protein